MWANRTADPFSSISDLSDDEAAKIAHAMGKRVDGDYMAIRKEAEAWLRAHAQRKGHQTLDNPLYFKLVREPGRATYPENYTSICIPADSIPADHLTLTIDDSFFNYMLYAGNPASNTPKGLVPQVISGSEADRLVDLDGAHRDFLSVRNEAGATRYIEVQLWTRDIPIINEARDRFYTEMPPNNTIIVEPRRSEGASGPPEYDADR